MSDKSTTPPPDPQVMFTISAEQLKEFLDAPYELLTEVANRLNLGKYLVPNTLSAKKNKEFLAQVSKKQARLEWALSKLIDLVGDANE